MHDRGARGVGPSEATTVVRDAQLAVTTLRHLVDLPSGAGSRQEWLELAGTCQDLVNTVTAVQDAAIARTAAIEEEYSEDGTVLESDLGAGHVALDAPDLVAGALHVSHVHAERRVTLAVRCAGDGPAGTSRASGLRGVHEAMLAGRVDGYRAAAVAEELTEAPAEVAAAVVLTLEPYLGTEPAAALRQRCRRALARVSPDLLRQRAVRARRECGLRRWAAEPGVDSWVGTFPSEDAAMGWAAVDGLAQRYVADGVCERVEQARGKALIDLVTGSATVDARLLVTVPAPGAPGTLQPPPIRVALPQPPTPVGEERAGRSAAGSSEDLVEVMGALPGGQPALVARGWLSDLGGAAGADRAATPPARATCHPGSGALLDVDGLGGAAYRPGGRLGALVRARDGVCRFPGCAVAARFCDLDHVVAWPSGPTTADNLMCLCRRHHRVKQRPGWSVRLRPDAVASWRDPTGRVRVSHPRDLLRLVVLPARSEVEVGQSAPGVREGGSGWRELYGAPEDAPHSALEFILEHALASTCGRGRRSEPRGHPHARAGGSVSATAERDPPWHGWHGSAGRGPGRAREGPPPF